MDQTIFITCFHSYISKNILDTNAFKKIQEHSDLKIVLFVPEIKKDFFERVYGNSNVIIEGVNLRPVTEARIEKFFYRLSYLLLNSHYLHYKKKETLLASSKHTRYIKYYFESVVTFLFSGHRIVNSILRFSYLHCTSKNFLSLYFNKYKPDLIFATDVFDASDTIFLKVSKKHKVFSIGMVRSWDNCWSKGVLRVLPDKLIVNNPAIKKEAMVKHNMKAENIFISGLPQFDHFINEKRTSKADFFARIKADINKHLILFAPAGAILSDTDWQICEILNQAILNSKFIYPVQFLVRNHPNHPADLSKFQTNNNFILEIPGKTFTKNIKDTELTHNDTRHLADSLYYSDIILWVATTLGLDALMFDKPQIVVNFDGWGKKDYIYSVKKYHHEDHMKAMLDLGGMKMANTAAELIEQINNYLTNHNLDKEKRSQVIEQQLFKIDGHSGNRVAQCILSELTKLG